MNWLSSLLDVNKSITPCHTILLGNLIRPLYYTNKRTLTIMNYILLSCSLKLMQFVFVCYDIYNGYHKRS